MISCHIDVYTHIDQVATKFCVGSSERIGALD